MTRKDILDRIDTMVIHEKDYETLTHLLENADDTFFVNALESIFNGELYNYLEIKKDLESKGIKFSTLFTFSALICVMYS